MATEKHTGFFSGLNFQRFGSDREARGGTCTHPFFYGVQYIHSGMFYLALNGGREFVVSGPAAFLTSPETHFSYGSPPGTSRQQIHVCFDGPRVRKYLETGLFRPACEQETPYTVIRSPKSFLADMLELVLLLQQERYDFAVAKLEYILLSLQHQDRIERRESYHREPLDALALQIIAQPERSWDFAAEAAKLHVSLKHFMRLFRQCHGMPPGNFVLRQRLYRACELLVQEQLPVKAVADRCGFGNEFYFSRIFKKYMLFSPSVYRNRHRAMSESSAPNGYNKPIPANP